MGKPENPAPPYAASIGCLQLSRNDHLRLVNLPPDLIPMTRDVITTHWPKGIQKEGDFEGCSWEFKCKGNPCEFIGPARYVSRRL